jgi:putative membrane protein
LIQTIRTIVGGFLMGTADLVPGVSGGTIALVLGIYERLVGSVRQGSSALGGVVKFDLEGFRTHLKRVEWGFLLPLLGGILLAVVLLASFLEDQLEERPTVLAGLFLGLVVGSVVIAWKLIDNPTAQHRVIVVVVALSLFVLLGLGEAKTASDPSYLAFFGAGALAICAMILPGISGSLILLLLGMYAPILGAVSDRDLTTIAVVGLGAVVGLALFSQVLNWALKNHHGPMLAGLVGLMAGSTRVLWPWPDGVFSADLGAPGDDWPVVVVATFLGAGLVYLISRMAAADSATSEQQLSSQAG